MIRFKYINTEKEDALTFGRQEKEEARIITLYNEGLQLMVDESTIKLSFTKFQQVIEHFATASVPVVGIKRPLPEEEVAETQSTLDHVHFLSHKNIAQLYYEISSDKPEKSIRKAIQHYYKALALNNKDVWIWHRLGTLLMQINHLSEARMVLEFMIGFSPDYVAGVYDYIALLYRIGDYAECTGFLISYRKRFPLDLNFRSLWEQLQENRESIPTKFITNNSIPEPNIHIVELGQLSWLALGHLLLDTFQDLQKAPTDPLSGEPSIKIQLSTSSMDHIQESPAPSPVRKRRRSQLPDTPTNSQEIILATEEETECMKLIESLFNEKFKPFESKSKPTGRRKSQKIEIVSKAESNSLTHFLSRYAGVLNQDTMEYHESIGNAGICHLISLFLNFFFQLNSRSTAAVVHEWNIPLQEIITELSELPNCNINGCESLQYELVVAEIFLDRANYIDDYSTDTSSLTSITNKSIEYITRVTLSANTPRGLQFQLGAPLQARIYWIRGCCEELRQNSLLANLFIKQSLAILSEFDEDFTIEVPHCLNTPRINAAIVARKLEKLETLNELKESWEFYNQGNFAEVYSTLAPSILKSDTNDLLSCKTALRLLRILGESCLATSRYEEFIDCLYFTVEKKIVNCFDEQKRFDVSSFPLEEMNSFLEETILFFEQKRFLVTESAKTNESINKLVLLLIRVMISTVPEANPEEEHIIYAINTWIVLYYLFALQELALGKVTDRNLSSLTAGRLHFLSLSLEYLSDKRFWFADGFKIVHWVRSLLFKELQNFPFTINATKPPSDDDVFYEEEFRDLLGKIMFVTANIKLVPYVDKLGLEKANNCSVSPDNIHHILVALLYFDRIFKSDPAAHYQKELPVIHAHFKTLKEGSNISERQMIEDFIDGSKKRLRITKKVAPLVSEEDWLIPVINRHCFLLFATQVKNIKSEDKKNLLLHAIAEDIKHIAAWKVLAEMLLHKANADVEAGPCKTPEKQIVVEANFKKCIRILDKVCSLTTNGEELAQELYNSARFFYVLCQYTSVSSAVWTMYQSLSKEMFTKSLSLGGTKRQKESAKNFLGKIQEKTFFRSLSSSAGPGLDFLAKLDGFLSAFQTIAAGGNEEALYKLHASRTKFLIRYSHGLAPLQISSLCDLLFKYQYKSSTNDNTLKGILQDCSDALQSLPLDHRAVFLRTKIQQELHGNTKQCQDILSAIFNLKKTPNNLTILSKNQSSFEQISNRPGKYSYYYEKYLRLWVQLNLELQDYKTLSIMLSKLGSSTKRNSSLSSNCSAYVYQGVFKLCREKIDQFLQGDLVPLQNLPKEEESILRSICSISVDLYNYSKQQKPTEAPTQEQHPFQTLLLDMYRISKTDRALKIETKKDVIVKFLSNTAQNIRQSERKRSSIAVK